MKKLSLSMAIGVLMIVALVGCSSGESGPGGTAAEIADKIFTEAGVEPFGTNDTIDTDDKMNWFLGSTNYEFADSAVVLPMISLDTRALYVLKGADGSNVESIKTQLNTDIDPNKLICVSFSMEDVVIESRGDVVFMTINSNAEQRDALVTAFADVQ